MSPKSPLKLETDLDYAILTNKFFAKQVIADKDIFYLIAILLLI